jgi:exopolysaccharide biosynthesis protein
MDQTGQEKAVNSFFAAENEEKESFLKKLGRILAKLLLLLLETVLLIALVLYAGMYVLAKGPSPAIRRIFVTSVRETSAIGFLADLYLTPEEIAEIEAVKETREYAPTDTSLFTVGDDTPSEDGSLKTDEWGLVDEDGDGIIIVPVKGEGYAGYMMVVLDPSRVIVGSVPSNYGIRGFTVAQFAERFEAAAGTNAGGFLDPNGEGNGSIPDSTVVYKGEIYYADRGCVDGIAAIDGNHILHVATRMTKQELIDNDIQYAVCYGPVLISNGVPADPESLRVSLNPRTAIGQRSDKAMLLLVIDGRQASSMGASFQDEVEIMQRFGAVNAVNLDGGSSSMMWYGGDYINKTASVIGIRPVPTSILVLQEGAEG